jgi:hypothetical protein
LKANEFKRALSIYAGLDHVKRFTPKVNTPASRLVNREIAFCTELAHGAAPHVCRQGQKKFARDYSLHAAKQHYLKFLRTVWQNWLS